VNALVAEAMLTHYGHPVELRIGVSRNSGTFAAHAWVERDGEIVIGGPESVVRQYKPLDGLSL
jgi:hypothetical protein